jgi:hypothetical protein
MQLQLSIEVWLRTISDSSRPMPVERRLTLKEMLRPNGLKVLASLVATIVLGGAGMFAYIAFVDFKISNSFLLRLLACGLAWPVILIGKIAFGPGPISNFDPILFQKFGWLALGAYY